jgi:PPOX class probable F420-dependent enzyme
VDEADPLAQAPPAVVAFLRDGRVGRLATADATGRPLVVPVCYALDGAHLYSAIDAKPKRTRNLRRLRNIEVNPQVALVVDHYDEDWTALRYVIVDGAAEIVTAGADFQRAIQLLLNKYPQYRAMGLAHEASGVIKIRVRGLRHWRFDTPTR